MPPIALGSGACTAGIMLLGLPSPLHLSHRLSCSRGPAGCPLQSFTAVGPGCGVLSPRRSSSVRDPGSLGAPRPLLGSCPRSLPAPFYPGRIRVDFFRSCFSRTGLSYPGVSRCAAPRGGPSPTEFFFIYLFFPWSNLVRSANSSLCSIPAILSVNQGMMS